MNEVPSGSNLTVCRSMTEMTQVIFQIKYYSAQHSITHSPVNIVNNSSDIIFHESIRFVKNKTSPRAILHRKVKKLTNRVRSMTQRGKGFFIVRVLILND
jgi:hypothetical protein